MNNNQLKEIYGLNTETDIDFCKIVDKIKNKDTILKGIKLKYILFKSNNNNYKEKWIYCCIEKLASLYEYEDKFIKIKIINNIVNQLLILYDIDILYCLKNCGYLLERICEQLLIISTDYFKKIYYEKYEYTDYDKKNEIGINNMMKKILKNIQLSKIVLKEETEKIISKCYHLYSLKKKNMVELIKDRGYRYELYNNHFNIYIE